MITDTDNQKTIDELAADLTPKELHFANFYLGDAHFNSAKAAKLAGYAGDGNSLATTGWRNLRKPHVKAYIDAVMAEAMPAPEVVFRLAKIARSSINDVLADGSHVWFDKDKATENGSIHFVKKIKVKRFVKETKTDVIELPAGHSGDDDEDGTVIENHVTTQIISEEIDFEIHDGHAALRDLGRFHKLFTDNHDIKGNLNVADVSIYIPDNGR